MLGALASHSAAAVPLGASPGRHVGAAQPGWGAPPPQEPVTPTPVARAGADLSGVELGTPLAAPGAQAPPQLPVMRVREPAGQPLAPRCHPVVWTCSFLPPDVSGGHDTSQGVSRPAAPAHPHRALSSEGGLKGRAKPRPQARPLASRCSAELTAVAAPSLLRRQVLKQLTKTADGCQLHGEWYKRKSATQRPRVSFPVSPGASPSLGYRTWSPGTRPRPGWPRSPPSHAAGHNRS